MCAADMFVLTDLRDECAAILTASIAHHNVLSLLELAERTSMDGLRRATVDFLCGALQTSEALSDEWCALVTTKPALSLVVARRVSELTARPSTSGVTAVAVAAAAAAMTVAPPTPTARTGTAAAAAATTAVAPMAFAAAMGATPTSLIPSPPRLTPPLAAATVAATTLAAAAAAPGPFPSEPAHLVAPGLVIAANVGAEVEAPGDGRTAIPSPKAGGHV